MRHEGDFEMGLLPQENLNTYPHSNMIRSFRIKVSMISVLFSVILLLGFGFYCARVVYAVGLDRIDHELRALVGSEVQKEQPPNHWQRLYSSLSRMQGKENGRRLMLFVVQDQDVLFASTNWNPSIEKQMLPVLGPLRPLIIEKKKPARRQQKQRNITPTALAISEPSYASIEGWRVLAIKNSALSLCLAMDLTPLQAEVSRIWHLFWMALPVALIIMIAGGWLLANFALRPINLIARTAKKIEARNLSQRIPQTRTDREFRQLIELINQMLTRLEAGFTQAKRFSADAAHELKTPLTILQGQLEMALQAAPDHSAVQQASKESLDEVQRLKSIIRKLLLLSQADSGKMPLHLQTLNLTTMIQHLVEDISLLNPELEIRTDLHPHVEVQGDAELLSQVIQNLANNAVKFCGGQSPITLKLEQQDARAIFFISNRGATIPPEERDKIFDRFYRTDKSRSRNIDGSGLGLSLAREIAWAHAGTLELTHSTSLTTFRLQLPLARLQNA